MSSQYKENNFSTENFSASHTVTQNNTNKTVRANIGHLIKKISVERKREKKIITALGVVILSISLIFIYFQ
jgi:lipid II:glycine glycyltransferase (peptidoglycan interpeptide bridge formation enzyme)|tara:strand:- start:177 stop:389 length:213 start_codon:yes stop_codon:yes gene_type:complete